MLRLVNPYISVGVQIPVDVCLIEKLRIIPCNVQPQCSVDQQRAMYVHFHRKASSWREKEHSCHQMET